VNQQPFRLDPVGPVGMYQTYGARASQDTGVITACREAGCQAWQRGWETTVDEATALGQNQAKYIRTASGRTFTEKRTGEGLTVFVFESFQRCFTEHRTRPDLFTRRHGDWRGNPSGRSYTFARPQDWMDDMRNNQDKIDQAIKRG